MSLDTEQTVLELGKLYRVTALSTRDIEHDITASIWINSGSVDVHGSDSATTPTTVAEMTLNTGDTAVEGKAQIITLTNYIAITQNTGTTTEIVISGIQAQDLGAIS